jgi:hypothetical protein
LPLISGGAVSLRAQLCLKGVRSNFSGKIPHFARDCRPTGNANRETGVPGFWREAEHVILRTMADNGRFFAPSKIYKVLERPAADFRRNNSE